MNRDIPNEEKIIFLVQHYEFYKKTNILLSNEQITFYSDLDLNGLDKNLKNFFNKSKEMDLEQLQIQMDILVQTESAKEEAERAKENLEKANLQLEKKNEETLKALESEREFNKDFERIKAQNNLAQQFLMSILFLIVLIVCVHLVGMLFVNESDILTKQDKTTYIVDIVTSGSLILKELAILLIGIMGGVYSYLFYFKDKAQLSSKNKKNQDFL